MDIIKALEDASVKKLAGDRTIPEFRPGDTLKVNVRVQEGTRSRLQAFEGVCIARRNAGLNSSFTVRKISYGEGVERVFPLYSPTVAGIEVIRKGDVRRAKLYYLRGRSGKSARIAERMETADGGASAPAEAAPASAGAADAPPKPKKVKAKPDAKAKPKAKAG